MRKKLVSLRATVYLGMLGSCFIVAALINQWTILQTVGVETRLDGETMFIKKKKSMEYLRLPFNCEKLFDGDKSEASNAISYVYKPVWTDEFLKGRLETCSSIKKFLQISEHSCSSDEKAFPLAFSMIVNQNSEQFLRLFASIYRPQNIYCLTYDEKAPLAIKHTVHRISACFENVLQPDQHEIIHWGTMSVLRAALNCLQKLTEQVDHKWKYHQIVSWNDVPLKSNREMVQILQRLNGSSDAELKEGQSFRYTHHVEWITTGSAIPSSWKGDETFEQFGVTFYIDLSKPKPPPPGGLIIYKGSFAATLSRSVAEFIIQNQLVKDLIEWLSDTFVPDESLWTTVLFNKDVLKLPSLMDGKSCLAQVDKEKYAEQWISRYQLWPDSAVKCKGKWVHGSCVLGVKDLPHLRSAPQLFAHKFYLDFEPAAFFCMLQLIKNRTEET